MHVWSPAKHEKACDLPWRKKARHSIPSTTITKYNSKVSAYLFECKAVDMTGDRTDNKLIRKIWKASPVLFLSQKRTRQTHQVPGLSVHSQPIKGKCRKQKYQIICLFFLVKSDPVSGPSCNKTYGIQAIPCLWTDAFSGHSVTGLANSPSFVVVWRTLKKDELSWPPQTALYKGLYKSAQLPANQFFFTQLPPVEFASSFEHPWSSVAVLIWCRL